jgi:K+-transporting ATPase KdpF subunit
MVFDYSLAALVALGLLAYLLFALLNPEPFWPLDWALNGHSVGICRLRSRISPGSIMLIIAILGAFLLAAAQWLTSDGGKRSRVGVWLLLGVGVVLAALYAVPFLSKHV